MTNSNTIAFIGGGNMARSLIGGLIQDGTAPEQIWVSDRNAEQLQALQQRFGIHTSSDNLTAAAEADVLVLAVKPQVLHSVASELQALVQQRQPLVISVAAGIREQDLNRWLGGNVAIVRCMPNTPALIQTGASGLYANAQVSASQRDQAESILRAVGIALWLEHEAQMDAVTALSGSGPAYFFLFMEAMQNAAQALGLSADQAKLLTLQTALGASKMALESEEDCAVLRQRVTSPGGTTERALNSFEHDDLRASVQRALNAACERSRELADQLGQAGDA